MKTLLGYIGKERHADSLVEKLMLRFEAAHKPEQWKNLAFCLTQVCHKLTCLIILPMLYYGALLSVRRPPSVRAECCSHGANCTDEERGTFAQS